MKHKLKGLLLALCMVFSIVGLTGCGSDAVLKDDVKTLTEDQVASYKTSAAQTVQTVVAFSDDDIEQFLSQVTDAFSVSAVESWKGVKDDLGAFQEITEQAVEENGDEVTVTSKAVFEKATANAELVLDRSTGMDQPVSMSFSVNYSQAETMEQAGLNTLMGIGIVFLMLFFLSFLISQFKHIAKLEEKFTKKEEKAAPAASAPAAAQPEEAEELVDDGELVAVIAAAIAASENTSTDSFVVRSIKKSNARRWKRA